MGRRMQNTTAFLIADEHHCGLEHAMIIALTAPSWPATLKFINWPVFGHRADLAHIHDLSTYDQRHRDHNNILLRS